LRDDGYPRRAATGAKRKYPWDEMEVGETFVEKGRTMSSFSGALAYANQSRYPKKFRSRTVGADLEVRRVK
jgi:hypothetical protein